MDVYTQGLILSKSFNTEYIVIFSERFWLYNLDFSMIQRCIYVMFDMSMAAPRRSL